MNRACIFTFLLTWIDLFQYRVRETNNLKFLNYVCTIFMLLSRFQRSTVIWFIFLPHETIVYQLYLLHAWILALFLIHHSILQPYADQALHSFPTRRRPPRVRGLAKRRWHVPVLCTHPADHPTGRCRTQARRWVAEAVAVQLTKLGCVPWVLLPEKANNDEPAFVLLSVVPRRGIWDPCSFTSPGYVIARQQDG